MAGNGQWIVGLVYPRLNVDRENEPIFVLGKNPKRRPKFEITTREGYVNGPFGICVINGKWSLTHQKTGASVDHFRTLAKAKAVGDALLALPVDWNITKLSPSVKDMVETAINDEYDIPCEHDDIEWKLTTNEDGWLCLDCKEKLGFRPDLDRECLDKKVERLLYALHEENLIYVSNSTQGDVMTMNVCRKATDSKLYDQQNLLRFILNDKNLGDGTYWQTQAETWLREHEDMVRTENILEGLE